MEKGRGGMEYLTGIRIAVRREEESVGMLGVYEWGLTRAMRGLMRVESELWAQQGCLEKAATWLPQSKACDLWTGAHWSSCCHK
jgi:hypothetical protein